MLRLFKLALIAMCLPAAAQAQCTGPSFADTLSPAQQADLDQRAADTAYGTGLIWQAEKDGTTLIIAGTMHLPDPRHATLRDRLRPALEAADLLLVEATLQDQTNMQLYMAENPDLMAITDGPTLPEALPPDTWDAIVEAAAARSIPGFMAAKMQPWFLAMTLAMPPCAVMQMARGEGGLDALLMQDAASLGLPTAPLEPWEDMFALLSGGTFEDQIEALQLALFDPADQNALIVALTEFYFSEQTALSWHINSFTQDLIDGLDPATFEAQMTQLEEDLLFARNANWIPVIEAAATQHDKIVVAFGAAHLITDRGVLALLAQRGWHITRQTP
ncbi:TraB/GumN family protein [Pseudooctadecabacter jejudonensis]|uniref:TraB family protein n=1 Tax=Pseudooctadecabacter jejudonensis TaxID=1391910 RepID=A0A1Y5SWT5_9RHOB|nr:TraB/GumN family protein [Pseudooctadecabacter jejudonensis]SLN50532.1 TraB family protein [Pseudooctadecabacter jejudonensis]